MPVTDQRPDRIREYIATNRLREALTELTALARETGSKDEQNEALLLTREFADLERERRMGTGVDEERRVRERRAVFSALQLVDEFEVRSWPQDTPVPAPDARATAVELAAPAFQKIIGVNNLKQIAWLSAGLEAARAVCRILTPNGVGSGFLIGPRHVMTNNHVIPSAADAAKARIEFNYEMTFAGAKAPVVRYALNPDGFFKTSSRFELDYTVIEVTDASGTNAVPLSRWGHVLLNPHADPVPDEHVVIVQHPNGQPKQIAMTANAVLKVESPLLHYSTDTMSGSSGSPVFNDSWQVVAIHHREGPDLTAGDGVSVHHTNEGILMSAIVPHLGDEWR